jgi:hypothetical protein
MEEVFNKIQEMLGIAFEQGQAYQRQQDAEREVGMAALEVQRLYLEIQHSLTPEDQIQ